jgi:hypothetical protein
MPNYYTTTDCLDIPLSDSTLQQIQSQHSLPIVPVDFRVKPSCQPPFVRYWQCTSGNRTPANSTLDAGLSLSSQHIALGRCGVLSWLSTMRSVPFEFVASLAAEHGACECAWRESERSFTGFVAEVWFDQLPSLFAARWSVVVGYSVLVRSVSAGPARFAVSVPVVVPEGQVQLRGGQRGGAGALSVGPLAVWGLRPFFCVAISHTFLGSC